MKYYPKLDGIRALAVTGVLVEHYIPAASFVHLFSWGALGVQCFFVLSGYLITGILLESKKRGSSFSSIIRSFFARRFLRIFPPYYAMLFTCLAFGVTYTLPVFASALLYVFNIQQAVSPNGDYPYLGHIWSLCIEEQFYLIWPWIVLLPSPNRLLQISILLIVLSVLSRGILLSIGWDYLSVRNLPTSQLDALIGGSILAQISNGNFQRIAQQWNKIFIGVMAIAAIVYIGSMHAPIWSLQGPTLGLLASSIFFIGCITWATSTEGRTSRFPKILDCKPLVYLGKISYGIYLYHFISLFFVYKFISLSGTSDSMTNPWLFIPIWTVFTLLLATTSWHWFEKPILKLKRRFQY
ncbi:acyltransferase family protein [Cerasicoccus arenae]|uniref:acyltransferase family protein n=1 Tax=Cerasicoccus arenae TaxID=424488 RepID=UPI001678DED0|nr:acyltransferase [Cerasicoccus arenae]MBK1857491.1 acyltransferase [Cerasicoccus arenae]